MSDESRDLTAALSAPFDVKEVKSRSAKSIIDPVVRFWRLVEKISENGCWVFKGAAVGPKGHRRFMLATGKYILAHRYSWQLHHSDPGNLCVLHDCDNPPCVNPAHLFLGTVIDNNADMMRKGRYRLRLGAETGTALLTPDQVREIRTERRDLGTSYPKLAAKYRVGTSTIQSILEGKTWKWLL